MYLTYELVKVMTNGGNGETMVHVCILCFPVKSFCKMNFSIHFIFSSIPRYWQRRQLRSKIKVTLPDCLLSDPFNMYFCLNKRKRKPKEQSRDKDDFGHKTQNRSNPETQTTLDIRHTTKTNKIKNTTQKTK